MGVIITNNDEDKGGDIDSCGLYLIRVLIISLINLADLIISILFFDPNCMTFFVFKFIMIFLIFLFYFCTCCFYSFMIPENTIVCMYPLFLVLIAIASIILLGLEITFLVLFILNFSALNSIVLIFYFIHWAPIIMIYIFLYYRHKD